MWTIGQKVKLPTDFDIYPFISLKAGETGVVTWVHDNPDACGADELVALVQLDTHHPELTEWENEVQIFGTEGDVSCGFRMSDFETE